MKILNTRNNKQFQYFGFVYLPSVQMQILLICKMSGFAININSWKLNPNKVIFLLIHSVIKKERPEATFRAVVCTIIWLMALLFKNKITCRSLFQNFSIIVRNASKIFFVTSNFEELYAL